LNGITSEDEGEKSWLDFMIAALIVN
jgi:hypothetical protein